MYTALTRQEDKIIILYNDDPYHLLKFSTEEYSDIAKGFTDLFANVYKNNDGTSYKLQIVKVGDNFYEEKLIHRTVKGNLIVTYDNENGGLDSYEIENIIRNTFDL